MPGDFNDAIEKAAAVATRWADDCSDFLSEPKVQIQHNVCRSIAAAIGKLKRPEPDRSEVRERIAETLSSCRDYLQDIVGGATVSDRSIVNAIALVDEIDAILSAGLVPDEAAIRADEREKCACKKDERK